MNSARVGYVPGVWDLFHIGHLNLLRQARKHCDELVAGVVADSRALAVKGRLPVIPLVERLEIVRSIAYVDRAVEEDVAHKREMWEAIRFDVLIKGNDWQGTTKGAQLEADFTPLGVEIIYLPYTAHTSSSVLRRVLETLQQQPAEPVEQRTAAAG